MEAQPRISVILSTYNRAHYLSHALKALSEQDCDAPYEVIVVDNACTDNTASVIESWCRKDGRIRMVSEPRLGLSWGKNAGIRVARAPLLLFTDDDILADPRWIRAYSDFFFRHNDKLLLAGGPCIPIPHDLGSWPSWFGEQSLTDVALLNYREERVLTKKEWVWGGNMAVPAYLFEQFGLWDVKVGRKGDARGTFEDTEFQDRLRNAGGVVWFCANAVVHHRVDRKTITPRQIFSTAYARGRNEFWQESLRSWGELDAVPKRNLVKCLAILTGKLNLWTLWTMGFRCHPDRSLFELARHAAWSCGWSLGSLDAGRTSSRLYSIIARITFLLKRLVLRLTPDAP